MPSVHPPQTHPGRQHPHTCLIFGPSLHENGSWEEVMVGPREMRCGHQCQSTHVALGGQLRHTRRALWTCVPTGQEHSLRTCGMAIELQCELTSRPCL